MKFADGEKMEGKIKVGRHAMGLQSYNAEWEDIRKLKRTSHRLMV